MKMKINEFSKNHCSTLICVHHNIKMRVSSVLWLVGLLIMISYFQHNVMSFYVVPSITTFSSRFVALQKPQWTHKPIRIKSLSSLSSSLSSSKEAQSTWSLPWVEQWLLQGMKQSVQEQPAETRTEPITTTAATLFKNASTTETPIPTHIEEQLFATPEPTNSSVIITNPINDTENTTALPSHSPEPKQWLSTSMKPFSFAAAMIKNSTQKFIIGNTSIKFSKQDFPYLDTATRVQSSKDAGDFLHNHGITTLLSLMEATWQQQQQHDSKSRLHSLETINKIIQALSNIVLWDKTNHAADMIAKSKVSIDALTQLLVLPSRWLRWVRVSQQQQEVEDDIQAQVLLLMLRMVRKSNYVVDTLRHNRLLKDTVVALAHFGKLNGKDTDVVVAVDVSSSDKTFPSLVEATQQNSKAIDKLTLTTATSAVSMARTLWSLLPFVPKSSQQETTTTSSSSSSSSSSSTRHFFKGNTTVSDVSHFNSVQQARILAWSLGGVKFQQQQQQSSRRGLRILCIDGGGTRGVLAIALIKQLMQRIGSDYPHEVFDMICGTSTGGIIAVLLGQQQRSIQQTEMLYDSLVDRIFGKRSNFKLLAQQAAYDEIEFENILLTMCGKELMIDSNRHDQCPRVFCVSAQISNNNNNNNNNNNHNQPMIHLWRNYNYPSQQTPRYRGASRVNVFTAVRATSAAPTFFTPVHWHNNVYCDGALVANNPAAIAIQEAKILFPGVPVEAVVSVGTGRHQSQSQAPQQQHNHHDDHSNNNNNNNNVNSKTIGWAQLLNHIIATSIDTEDVHSLLSDFLPHNTYFRINPLLPSTFPSNIDERSKSFFQGLKQLARTTFDRIDQGLEIAGGDSHSFHHLFPLLRKKKRNNML